MSQAQTQSIIEIAELHKQRILQALAVVEPLFPINAQRLENLNETQLFAMEMLTNRFAKLQDLIGAKIFDLCLLSLGENVDGLSMIDKAHKLEKTSVLNSSYEWMELRKLRNNVTHEYPGHPEITASILNKLKKEIVPMLNLCDKMIALIKESGI